MSSPRSISAKTSNESMNNSTTTIMQLLDSATMPRELHKSRTPQTATTDFFEIRTQSIASREQNAHSHSTPQTVRNKPVPNLSQSRRTLPTKRPKAVTQSHRRHRIHQSYFVLRHATLAIFAPRVLALASVPITNPFLTSRNPTQDEHELATHERGQEARCRGDNV